MEKLLRAACAALLIACSAAALPARADVLHLHDAVTRALARDAQLDAFDAQVTAAGARAIADGALPDPELSLGHVNAPVDDLFGSGDMMTMTMVSVRQRFPAGATRHLRRSRGEVEADLLRAEREQHALALRLRVREVWLDWRLATEAEALIRSAEARLDELFAVTERRLATAGADRQDLARIRLELATLAERRLAWSAEQEATAAELQRWIGEPVSTPGSAPDREVPDPEQLAARLEQHPEVRAASLREALGEVGRDIALQAYKPTWMLEVGYGLRRGSDPRTGESRSDMVSGMVSVSLPLFPARRQDQRLQSAVGEREAARFERLDLQRDLLGRQQRQWAAWRRHADRVELYEGAMLPAAADTRLATLDAYRNDRARFDEVVRSELDELERRLGALLAARQRDAAHIELLYLGGEQ